jgi:hypothetical protein
MLPGPEGPSQLQPANSFAGSIRHPLFAMRILFLSQVLPYPLDAGPKMRSYFVLRHLDNI